MPTYIGENKIIDRYLGDKFLEAAYIGDKKVYDPYTEITGYLPMIYKSRAAVALKNYRIYGTSEGAGVETENISKGTETGSIWSNSSSVPSYMRGTDVDANNRTRTKSEEYYKFSTTQSYTISTPGITGTQISVYTYDPDDYASLADSAWTNLPYTFTPSNYNYRFVIRYSDNRTINNANYPNLMITEGSTAPDHYIPHGYKLPLTVESGETENLWDAQSSSLTVKQVASGGAMRWALAITEPGIYTVKCFDSRRGYIYCRHYRASTDEYGTLYTLSIPEEVTEPVQTATLEVDSDTILMIYLRDTGAADEVATRFNLAKLCVVPGSTPPDHYIPHRYTSDIPIYIGSSKLGEEEYVDFGEQKVYKRTENLFDANLVIPNSYYNNVGVLTPTEENLTASPLIPVENGETYIRSSQGAAVGNVYVVFDNDKNFLYRGSPSTAGLPITVEGNGAYIGFTIDPDTTPLQSYMFTKGSTAPASYIPYLQPTDPPVPLPPIPTYKGENTLSSTEALGEVTVKGRIGEAPIT